MFAKNESHRQEPLISTLNSLPAKQQERLKESWAGTFYEEVFCRIKEEDFAVMYSDAPSRPNVPVNVLMGLEILKAGHDWTDEEMYENFSYNLQVRYALGYRNLDEGHFELRTVYNFRRRHVQHMAETGENLFEVCFEGITDEQLEAYQVKSGTQRVDSKQVASNIREMSRLQLLVEVVQRVYRMLNARDKMAYQERFAPYIKDKSGKYIYRLKGETHRPHIEKIGELMSRLVKELATEYETDETYQVLKRVFDEHFIEAESLQVKEGKELSASSLQSPDDLEATYRHKRGEGHVGYVVNVTETADPDNELQLITKIQTASNDTDDAAMLAEALPTLAERTNVETIYADGTYSSPEVDKECEAQKVELVQTAIRGATPDSDTLSLTDFAIDLDTEGKRHSVTCPQGQSASVRQGRKHDRFIATFDQSICKTCPLLEQCPTKKRKRKPKRVLYFSTAEAHVARRRRRMAEEKKSERNLRAAVEATVREITCRFAQAKLRVRGKQRVHMTLLASAAMANARRIFRYQQAQVKQENNSQQHPLSPLKRLQTGFICSKFITGFIFRVQVTISPYRFSLA